MRFLFTVILIFLSISANCQLPKMCGEEISLDVNYIDESSMATLRGGVFDDSTETGEERLEIYIYDELHTVAHFFTDPKGLFKISNFKPGVYDIELHKDGRYYRFYDFTVSKFEVSDALAELSKFMDEKPYKKDLKSRHKNRWNK